MHFCDVCQNMYYIRIDEESGSKLIYYCRKCGNENSTLTESNVCVSKTSFHKDDSHSFTHIINDYTKFDPTLPRFNSVLCPNADCTTNTKGKEREIIYIRYDEVNLKYMYLCSTCDTTWKASQPA
jgi:DNA-directed RNA polymerase subunit M/transcription elongation factor TFIIS